MQKIVYLIVAGLLTLLASAQNLPKTITYYADPGQSYEPRLIDVTHLEAHITPDTISRTVSGNATFTFNTLRVTYDTLKFPAFGLTPSAIQINSHAVTWNQKNSMIYVNVTNLPLTPTGNTLSIIYRSDRTDEPYFIGWSDSTFRMRRQIWAHRPFGWLPYLSDRLTVDLFITFSSDYMVYSNGIRTDVINHTNGTSTWHYTMLKPHPFFSTALVIGKYAYHTLKTDKGLPLEYWYYPDQEEHFEPTYRYSQLMFSYLEKELGVAYPWELYRQAPVADYLYGAMETTTATIFGDYLAIDERGWWGRNYVNVNVHELTHQWFGNYIAHEPQSDVWLTESLATYYAKLFERSLFGESQYQRERLTEMKKALDQGLTDNFPLAHSRAGSFRWYQKGSLVLDMLRNEMGDSQFKKAMTHYLKKFAYSEASSHDFIKAFYEVTGIPMNWFFDQWLFRGGEPNFSISLPDSLQNSDITVLDIRQIQTLGLVTGRFRVHADVVVAYSNGTKQNYLLALTGNDTLVNIRHTDKSEVKYIVFDSGNKLLKRMNFERSPAQLGAAATQADLAIDRYEALTAMRQLPIDSKRTYLLQSAGKSEDEFIFREVLTQLKDDTNNLSQQFFTGALRHPDALIRRAAIENMIMRSPADTARVRHLLFDPDYVNVEKTLRLLCAFMPENSAHWLSVTAAETGWRGRNIRIAWLGISIQNGNKEHLNELIDYSTNAFEFETRINAIRELQALDYLDANYARLLYQASQYFNPKLSAPAREAIQAYLANAETRATMERALNNK